MQTSSVWCMIVTSMDCRYKDDKNAFPECSIFDDNPGQGRVPQRLLGPSFFDLIDCDPCIGSDYSSDESSNEINN